MEALFIGQAYIDVTFLTDEIPTGDEKAVAEDYSISFGGNAVTAAFCCAKLGIAPDLLASVADDWLGRMFIDMASKYSISVHHRKVAESSLSFLGLGVQPPTPSWGSMIADGRDLYQLRHAPWTSVFPGLAIGAAVLGFNLLGDALRDAIDPRASGRVKMPDART